MSTTIAPGFLVAVPQLQDPNFHQTVVLMLEQTDEGSMGVVINRESPLLLRELCDNHEIPYRGDPEKRVRLGGPVQPEQGLVIYGAESKDPEGRVVVGDLHASASTGTLTRLCAESGTRFHCYTGYAGWGPGQLEREIGEGSWILIPSDSETVLECPPEQIWTRVLTTNGFDPGTIMAGGGAEA